MTKNIYDLYKGYRKKIDEVLTESEASSSIPYTKEDSYYNEILEVTRTQFGANYSNIKQPMLFYPKDNDVTLNGEIPSLNAKFQFRLNGIDGCSIWFNPLLLDDEVLKKLQIINAIYKNWKNELTALEQYSPIGYRQ